MSRYVHRKQTERLPRVPLKGSIDLTYRCNNDCRHCWLRLGPESAEAKRELTFDEIRRLVDEARTMGCRSWTISGGEPMIRPDFPDIFAYVTEHSAAYTLNTNGTSITPRIARLMKRKGAKLIALYGATAEVHDHITRTPGSFEALKKGIAYLREEKAGFTAQIVPMKDNFHQYRDMIRLAESWSPSWRIGAAWLCLSAAGAEEKNREIISQRLDPEKIIELDPLYGPGPERLDDNHPACGGPGGGNLYAECIASRRDFHIDPYGGMSFCSLAKDPVLRSGLRATSFRKAWDEDLPSMADKVKAGPGYLSSCGACDLRPDCRWCPVYAYLEHGDHSARVDYLCRAAGETRKAKAEWIRTRRRFYRIGGITVQLDSDLPISEGTFRPKFDLFRAGGPGEETISIRHHFSLPDLEGEDLGEEVYRNPPWAIYRKGGAWIYFGIHPHPEDRRIHRVIIFSEDHTRARIFNPSAHLFLQGGLDSLMLLPSDQIFLARALPRFGAAFVHAAGVDLRGSGLLFAGPSDAGKSTIIKMLMGRARVLCDDRMIVRRGPDGFEIHGSWSHGEVPAVSPEKAPLRAVFFLRQASENRLERIESPAAILRDFLPRFVRPLVTAGWWEDVLSLAGEIARTVPFYDLFFDKSGGIVERLEELAG